MRRSPAGWASHARLDGGEEQRAKDITISSDSGALWLQGRLDCRADRKRRLLQRHDGELADDVGAAVALARIVRGADFADQLASTPESAGLRAISDGFPLVAHDDDATVERASFLYDALYASLKARLAGNA